MPFPAASLVVAAMALLASFYAKESARPLGAVRPMPSAAASASIPEVLPPVLGESPSLEPPPAPAAPPAPTPTPTPAPTPATAAAPAKAGSASSVTPAAAAAVAAPAPPAAPAAPAGASRQEALTNQARASAGLPPLAWSACLAGIAQQHAGEMAAAGHIYHGDGVERAQGCGLDSRQTGENVGFTSPGIDDSRVFDAFMQSSGHRANILGPYHYVGTDWVLGADGAGYVSVEFA